MIEYMMCESCNGYFTSTELMENGSVDIPDNNLVCPECSGNLIKVDLIQCKTCGKKYYGTHTTTCTDCGESNADYEAGLKGLFQWVAEIDDTTTKLITQYEGLFKRISEDESAMLLYNEETEICYVYREGQISSPLPEMVFHNLLNTFPFKPCGTFYPKPEEHLPDELSEQWYNIWALPDSNAFRGTVVAYKSRSDTTTLEYSGAQFFEKFLPILFNVIGTEKVAYDYILTPIGHNTYKVMITSRLYQRHKQRLFVALASEGIACPSI